MSPVDPPEVRRNKSIVAAALSGFTRPTPRLPPLSTSLARADGFAYRMPRKPLILAHDAVAIADSMRQHLIQRGLAETDAAQLTILSVPSFGHARATGRVSSCLLIPSTWGGSLHDALERWSQGSFGRRPGDDEESKRCLDIQLTASVRLTVEQVGWGPGRLHEISSVWASVTPIALEGPGGSAQDDPEGCADAVRLAAWSELDPDAADDVDPAQIRVVLSGDSPVAGAASLALTPPFHPAGQVQPARLTHAVIAFPRPVRGPLVIGAGRRSGLGLCVPVPTA